MESCTHLEPKAACIQLAEWVEWEESMAGEIAKPTTLPTSVRMRVANGTTTSVFSPMAFILTACRQATQPTEPILRMADILHTGRIQPKRLVGQIHTIVGQISSSSSARPPTVSGTVRAVSRLGSRAATKHVQIFRARPFVSKRKDARGMDPTANRELV